MPIAPIQSLFSGQLHTHLITFDVGGGGVATLVESPVVESITRTAGGRYDITLKPVARRAILFFLAAVDRGDSMKTGTYVPGSLQEATIIKESYDSTTGVLKVAIAPQAIGLEIQTGVTVTSNQVDLSSIPVGINEAGTTTGFNLIANGTPTAGNARVEPRAADNGATSRCTVTFAAADAVTSIDVTTMRRATSDLESGARVSIALFMKG